MELISPLFVNTIAILAIIGGIALSAWLITAFLAVHSRKVEKDFPEVDLPGHLHEIVTGAPPAIVVLIIFIAITMLSYVLCVWLTGVTY